MHLTWLLAKLRKFVLHLTEAPRADNTFNLHAPSRPGGICQMDTELPLRPSHHVQNMFTTIMQPIFTSRQMHIKIMCTSATECHFRRIATQIIFPSNEPCNSAASRNFDYIDGHQSCASNRNIIAVSIGPLLRFELASALKQKNKLPKIHDYVYALPRKKIWLQIASRSHRHRIPPNL